MQSEVLRVDVNVDIRKNSTQNVGVTLMSQDINNYSFYLRVLQDGELLVMDETYEVEVLSVFTTSKSRLLTKGTIKSQYVDWVFDTSYISKSEVVKNYVYVRKNGVLLVSADANCFIFSVGLSAIDSDVGRVAEVYDENYEKVLLDYSGALDDRTTERLDLAVDDFNQRGDAEIADWRTSADSELEDYLADRFVLKNLVVNGDFSQGTKGWLLESNWSISSSRLEFEGEGTVAYNATPEIGTLDINDTYYLRYYLDTITGTFETGIRYGINGFLNLGTRSVQGIQSQVQKPTDTTFRFRASVAGDDGYFDNILLINLTKTFGAGNEPSKEWMDRLVEKTGYFDEHILDENWQVGELLRLEDTKANKVQEDWITPTLLNGAVGTIKYRKNEFGRVEFSGSVTYPTDGSKPFLTLPSGYHTGSQMRFSVASIDGVLSNVLIWGNSMTFPTVLSNKTVNLSNLSFIV